MFVVPITIEPFTIDDPNANYGVQLTGDLQGIVTDANKAFFMIERFNSAMSSRLRLNTKDKISFQLAFSSDVSAETMKAAYLLNMTTVFLAQHADDPDDGENRAILAPPINIEGTSYAVHGNTLVMCPPTVTSWEFGTHCFQTEPIEICMDGSLSDVRVYQLHVMGTLGIQTETAGPLYYLPFSHNPILVITVAE